MYQISEFEILTMSDKRVQPDTKKPEVSLSSAILPNTVPTAFARSEAKVIFKVFPRSVRITGVHLFGFFFLIFHYVLSSLQ